MFSRISVIGAGGWGTALAILLASNRAPVRLWVHGTEAAERLLAERVNADYLPDVPIPGHIEITNDLALAAEADLLVMVVPSRAFREVSMRLAATTPPADAVLVSCTKGIEKDTGFLMTEVLGDCLPGHRLGVLSGPNLAAEVARGIPAAGVIGSSHAELLPGLQAAFSSATYRAYTSEDVKGIQLGGALKNVFAIGAGASDGLRMGNNAKAALVTRALAEMTRLGVALGGSRETFAGLSGVGDLMVTCFSDSSRNRGFGERVGRGETPAEIQASMKMVAEGVPTARSALQCAERLGVDAPIISQINAVLNEGRSPRDAMWELLVRPPKPEAEHAPA
jgi:glycerol-3-phosphate dehydrogenase (NAD(P)+)